MRVFKDIPYDVRTDEQRLDLYLPESNEFSVFVYFHGGGIEVGDKYDDKMFSRFLTDRGVAFATANYQMYPNAKYPDFINDAASAVSWVMNNISSYGKCKGVFVGGSSAGAYLSMMLCFDKRYLGTFGFDPLEISGWLHDAGQPTTHFNVLKERGIDSRRVIVDEASPLYHVGEALSYSPMTFIVSDNDMAVRYEQIMLMISTLKSFGVEDTVKLKTMNGTHCKYVYKLDERGEPVFGNIILDFIGEVTVNRTRRHSENT